MIKLEKRELTTLETFFKNIKKQLDNTSFTSSKKTYYLKRFGISYPQLNNIVKNIKKNHTKTIRKNIKTFIEKSNESIKLNNQDKKAVIERYKVKIENYETICKKLGIEDTE